MAGHSKWAQIKRQKATTDKQKGQAFTKLGRAISIAVREGGGVVDPEMNFKLRLAVEKARQANMPKANIERAIASGEGNNSGQAWESLMYEGYGPGSAAVLVEAVTNSRNRTIAELKQAFEKNGGTLGQLGMVGYLFDRVGSIHIKKKVGLAEDEMILNLMDVGGVLDIESEGDELIAWTEAGKLKEAGEQIRNQDFELVSTELTMKPKMLRELDEEGQEKVINLLEKIEDLDDVQEVYCDAEV